MSADVERTLDSTPPPRNLPKVFTSRPPRRSSAVGALSYAGRLDFGITGDADACPDLAKFADGLRDALAELGVSAPFPHAPQAARLRSASLARPLGRVRPDR